MGPIWLISVVNFEQLGKRHIRVQYSDGFRSNSKHHLPSIVIMFSLIWVAVKELNLSYYIGETLLFTVYTHYGNLI